MADEVRWRPMTSSDIDDHRRKWPDLKKDWTLEYDTAHDNRYPNIEDAPLPTPTGPVRNPEEPRKVIDKMLTDMVEMAHRNPERAKLYARIAQRHDPSLRDKTLEEIVPLLVQHFEAAARQAVETVYASNEGWDKGNDVTAWDTGLYVPSGTVSNVKEKVQLDGDNGESGN